ncbi:MAG: hypothetical protein RL685_7693 [Pseudomonadota bacterium]|jgi:transposase
MIPAGTKVYFAVAPTDLRKSFDGLSALASGQLQKDPSEGGLFVFLNKRGDQVRVLSGTATAAAFWRSASIGAAFAALA